MVNTTFEAYKLRRELRKIGKEYEFKRIEKDKFGEPVGEPKVVGKLRGLYHEQNGYVSIVTGETTQTRSKKVPMILCLYEDAKFLKVNDRVEINSKNFKVTGIVNIQEWNLIADISLEVIDNVVQN